VKVVESLAALREARAELEEPLGLMPTLGYLHSGHLSLVRQARQICASVAASIFVNPTQFGPAEDLSTYPRDLDRDLALLEAEGVDLVWVPSNEEVYPPGFQTWVQVEQVSQPLEGAYRPGHFRGVTTVVLKLFTAFQPQRAYFGQKDAQQVVVIKRMVQDLNLPVKIEVCPTVREPDGLAMSSRNSYLDPAQRRAASVLYRALQEAEQAFEAGERQAQTLRERLAAVVAAEPLARPQYISVADPETLQELSGSVDRALLSMAVYIGRTRLIDNLVIEAGG
jgi:pantoate--beta-alanine ligase